MKNAKKGLQKFTDLNNKVSALLKKKSFEESDIADFSENEKAELYNRIAETHELLKGDSKKALAYLNKIEPILEQDVKNQVWENNHAAISVAISDLMQENGRMPNKNEIANKTGLSRPTIHKHLKDYNAHPAYKEQLEAFKFMSSMVMAKVFKFAVRGDIRAAKLYLEFAGCLHGQSPNNTSIHNQTNNIQTNGIVLSHETIRQLSDEQLIQLETILKSVANILPQSQNNFSTD